MAGYWDPPGSRAMRWIAAATAWLPCTVKGSRMRRIYPATLFAMALLASGCADDKVIPETVLSAISAISDPAAIGDGIEIKEVRDRVRRLMRLLGLEAIYRKPRTSVANPEHRVYPYLLRGLTIAATSNQGCPRARTSPTSRSARAAFLYLVAIMPTTRPAERVHFTRSRGSRPTRWTPRSSVGLVSFRWRRRWTSIRPIPRDLTRNFTRIRAVPVSPVSRSLRLLEHMRLLYGLNSMDGR